MKKNLLYAIVFIAFFCSCKKEKGPTASFDLSKSAYYMTEPVLLSNNTADATSYNWDFGDGHKSTEKDPQYSYIQHGTFTIKLTVNGGATTTRTVRILPGTASYEVHNNTSIAVSLTSFAVDAQNYIIDLHDHGTIQVDGKSDTIYTKNINIYIGGTLYGKKFVAFPSHGMTKFTHNPIAITDQSQILLQNSFKEKSIQVLPGKKTNKQTLKSIQ